MTETGVIIERKGKVTRIRMDVEARGACEKCGIQGICSPGNRERVLELLLRENFNAGDRVSVEIREGRSVLLSFLIFIAPIIVFLGAYLAVRLLAAGSGEPVRILSALGASVAYFVGMALLQEKLLKGIHVRRI